MAKKKEVKSTSKTDDLANVLADSLNTAYKDEGKVAFFLSEGDDPSLISDWISTGSSLLDLAISNRPNGGIPTGRITELTGTKGKKFSIWSHSCGNSKERGCCGINRYRDKCIR